MGLVRWYSYSRGRQVLQKPMPCLFLSPSSLAMISATLLTALALRKKKERIFKDRLQAEGRRRRDNRIPQIALQSPTISASCVLFSSGSDQALISITGFDHRVFNYILQMFAAIHYRYPTYSSDGRIKMKSDSALGRNKRMSGFIALGLSLSWYRNGGSIAVLCLLFGVMHSV